MPFSASRRELLIGGAATALSPVSAIESLATAFAGKRTMRVAHMSDFHAQPELNAPSGMRKSLQHMMSLKPQPSLILGGGDLIMDSFAATEERTALQWKIFSDILNAETKIPFQPTMGSEDFSYFLQALPGCYFVLGNGDGAHREMGHGGGPCMLHNPSYDFNDDLIPLGGTYWVELATQWLAAPAKA
jgi:metal-dependent amidase/aminoacylase/carboxypeptidase family protein